MSNQLERERIARCDPGWSVFRLKRLARLKGGGTPSKENELFWTNGDIPWVSPKDMKRRVIIETEDYITADAVDGSATSFVETGSPLLVVRSGILRHTLPVAISGRRVTLNQDMKAFTLRNNVDANFFAFWIEGQSSELLLEWRQFGATVESIDTARMMNGLIALPDLSTQRAIANFLDGETTRIDQLVEKKQRMVALALEAQAARLDQMTFNAPESSEWRRMPFKWVCRIPNGQIDPKAPPWADLPLIAPNHIESGTGRILLIETARDQAAESGKYTFPGGTVLYSKIRPALAKACIAPETGLCSADMYPVIPSSKLLPTYLLMQLLSQTFTDWAVLESMRVAMPKVNRESLGAFRLIVPPINIQHALAESWTADKTKTEALVSKVTASTDRLRELRSTLITAAVTGQIDVARWGKGSKTDRLLDEIKAEVAAATPPPERKRATA